MRNDLGIIRNNSFNLCHRERHILNTTTLIADPVSVCFFLTNTICML